MSDRVSSAASFTSSSAMRASASALTVLQPEEKDSKTGTRPVAFSSSLSRSFTCSMSTVRFAGTVSLLYSSTCRRSTLMSASGYIPWADTEARLTDERSVS